jgi:nucleoside 2-deoxyribosyltransferase
MSENCFICKSELKEKPVDPDDGQPYDCPRCGLYLMSSNTEKQFRGYSLNEDEIAVLSYGVRRMQKQKSLPPLNMDIIQAILKNSLPSITEQANNLILWYGNSFSPGKMVGAFYSTLQSIIGAKTPQGVHLIIEHLISGGLLFGSLSRETNPISAKFKLTVEGWQYFEDLKRGSIGSRKAFMAMEYGDEQLDMIFENYFKLAVKDAGFDLIRLDENPQAGLIDDRLRVEIQTSRFLVSDLTHENAGAYWEAGFAEGLGKPVIYTCEEEKFKKAKTHFDTNHHLTVPWDKDNPQEAVELLKATIRATLPNEAKLTDD